MTRTDMLKALSCVPFVLIDPLSEWEDIGFTERPIWVNSKGYGYIMCDEPCSSCEVDGVPLEKWKTIHQKLADGSLQLEDIEGTSLSDLLEEITHGYFDKDEDYRRGCFHNTLRAWKSSWWCWLRFSNGEYFYGCAFWVWAW